MEDAKLRPPILIRWAFALHPWLLLNFPLEEHGTAIETLFGTLDQLSTEDKEQSRTLIGFKRNELEL